MKRKLQAAAAIALMLGLTAPVWADNPNDDEVEDISWAELTLPDPVMLGPAPAISPIRGGAQVQGRAVAYCILNCEQTGQQGPFDLFQDSRDDGNDGGPSLRYNPEPRR